MVKLASRERKKRLHVVKLASHYWHARRSTRVQKKHCEILKAGGSQRNKRNTHTHFWCRF